MKFIDTHAHIYLDHFSDDIEEVIQQAQQQGIEKILLPNIDEHSINDMLALEEKYPNVCYAMMGLHPCSVAEDFEKQLKIVEEWLAKRKFLAVGEIGTDLYWDKTYWERQQEAFNFQCALAVKHDLPVVIHCRESIDQTIELASKLPQIPRGVFHCYTGTIEQAEVITGMGFYLGFGGVATFKNGGLDRVIPEVDPSKILLETDSPYLSPAPERGKRNEPAKLRHVAKKIAEYMGISEAQVAELTTRNADNLFFC